MRRSAVAGLAYFAVVFAAGFLLGTFRVLVLLPKMPEAAAVLVELPFMLAISYFAARWLVRRFAVAARVRARLAMGGIAFAVLLGAETSMSIALFGMPLSRMLAHYGTLAGGAGLAGQVVFALVPALLLLQQRRTGG